MRERLVLSGLTVAALLALASCSDDLGPVVVERFTATLNGANEVPPVTTTATGTATFTLLTGNILTYRLDVAGITGVAAAHIHAPIDPATNTGPVRVTLSGAVGGAFTGTLAEGLAPAVVGISMDSLLVLMRSGNSYATCTRARTPAARFGGRSSSSSILLPVTA